ncbi:MAG: hypothetical protein H7838_07440 [Magnetococcus sp. DMHC-8]
MSLAELQELTRRMTRADESLVTIDDVDAALSLAVLHYSDTRPRLLVSEVPAPAGPTLSPPDGWEAGFSVLRECETEGDDPSVAPTPLDVATIRLEETAGGWRMRLPITLSSGLLRLWFTTSHQLTQESDSLSGRDREAVVIYAAAHLLEQLAIAKSGDLDSTIGAASVSHSTPAREYAARAKTLRQRYGELLGVDSDRTPAAGVVVSLGSHRPRPIRACGW